MHNGGFFKIIPTLDGIQLNDDNFNKGDIVSRIII
jgi:hypothetical protein